MPFSSECFFSLAAPKRATSESSPPLEWLPGKLLVDPKPLGIPSS